MPQIYYVSVAGAEELFDEGISLLTAYRREKALRPRHMEDKLRSLFGSLLMRKYLGAEECSKITYNEHGKPYIENGRCFNISHSGDYVLIALSDCEIGVDIEKERTVNDNIIEKCFLSDEAEYAKQGSENFTRVWTMKEAVMKFLGGGFSVSPSSFSVFPMNEEITVFDKKLRIFSTKIKDYMLSVAYSGNEDTTLEEVLPKSLLI